MIVEQENKEYKQWLWLIFIVGNGILWSLLGGFLSSVDQPIKPIAVSSAVGEDQTAQMSIGGDKTKLAPSLTPEQQYEKKYRDAVFLSVFLAITISFFFVVTIICYGRLSRLQRNLGKYMSISNLDDETQILEGKVTSLQQEIANIQDGIKRLDAEYKEEKAVLDQDMLEKRTKMENEIAEKRRVLLSYHQQHETDLYTKLENIRREHKKGSEEYQKLVAEIEKLQTEVSIHESGFYTPHFAFNKSEEYRRQLVILQEEEKMLIRLGQAIHEPNELKVNGSIKDGKKTIKQLHTLMLRAFNGECEAILSKVRWDNIEKQEQAIRKAFEVVNKSVSHLDSYLTTNYLEIKLKELWLTHELQEKIKQEKEEQKRIIEDMREQQKIQTELLKAQEEAEKEEKRYQKALEKAQKDLEKAHGEQLTELEFKIQQLQTDLSSVQIQKQRAIAQAQLTKVGHVYIISNIGSFGENIYKIGMTRRLEPMDRVRELGDASVPFEFDVHAMIYSENAPDLEKQLHKQFASRRLNLMNHRKEFFHVTLDEIEKWATENKYELRLTKLAEARSYRESLAIRAKGEAERAAQLLEQAEQEMLEAVVGGRVSEAELEN